MVFLKKHAFKRLLLIGTAPFFAACADFGKMTPEVKAVDGRPCPAVFENPDTETAVIYRGNRINDPASLRMSAFIEGKTLRCRYDGTYLEADVKIKLSAVTGPALADAASADVPFPYHIIIRDPVDKGGRVWAKGVYFLNVTSENGADPEPVYAEKSLRLPLSRFNDTKNVTQADLPEILIGFEGNTKKQ